MPTILLTFCSRPVNDKKRSEKWKLSSKLKGTPVKDEAPSSVNLSSNKYSTLSHDEATVSPPYSKPHSGDSSPTPTQNAYPSLSQRSEKSPSPTSSADDIGNGACPLRKRSSEGSSRLSLKKKKLPQPSKKQPVDGTRESAEAKSQPQTLFTATKAKSAEPLSSSSTI